MDKQLIAKTLKSRGLKKSDLARALGIANSAVTSLLAGTRLLKADEVPKAKRFLGLDSVPLKGFVGASATASYFELPADDLDRVPAPENTTLDTVAVEIRGDSLGAPLDRWLVYYDNVQRSPTKSLFNRLCVVGLPDGRVLIKKLVPSKQKGLFHLIPTQGEIITDVPVDWAAPVKMMRPR